MKIFKKILILSICLITTLAGLVYVTTYHPSTVESIHYNNSTVVTLPNTKSIKILSWNVQYMASKNYVFFYDILDGSGKDTMPSKKDIIETLDKVAEVINKKKPDIVLLQEIDDNARRTGYMDQREELLQRLTENYNYAEAWYWKAAFVPHPKIMGRVGMKLVTLSKYPITEAVRYQLPVMRDNLLTKQFNFKRAVLSVTVDTGDKKLTVMNTHLDAFAQGEDTMQRQVEMVRQLLDTYTQDNKPVLIGGDFNLLMPGIYATIPKRQQAYYNPTTELSLLTEKYASVPSIEDTTGAQKEQWYTHYPNDPVVNAPDRTIDYIFYSPRIQVVKKQVLNGKDYFFSDHFPVVIEIEMK